MVLPQEKTPTADEKRDAEKAWEFLIKAKGGREKLHSITNMLYSRSDDGNRTQLYVFPDSKWDYGDFEETGRRLEIFDAKTATSYRLDLFGITSQYKTDPQYGNDVFVFDQVDLLLETKWFKPELLRVTQEKDGRRQLNVIETLVAKRRVDFVFEPKELLVLETRWHDDDGSVSYKERFFDYMEIDGIQMPQKISDGLSYISRFDKFKGLKHPVETKFLFNVNYLPDLFSNPQPAYGPDAWRHRSQHMPGD